MPINLIPQSTDVGITDSNSALLKALKQRQELAKILGGLGAQKQTQAPAFAPQNNAQAAFGYAGVLANAIGDRMIVEKEKTAQLQGAKTTADALMKAYPDLEKSGLNGPMLTGIILTNKDMLKPLLERASEARYRAQKVDSVDPNHNVYVTPSGPGINQGVIPGAIPPGMAPGGPAGMPAGPGGAPGAALPPPGTGGAPMAGMQQAPPQIGNASLVQQGVRQTAGQKSVDEAFGKDYASWRAGGGFVTAAQDLQNMRGYAAALANAKQNGKNYSGPITGNMGETLQSFLRPDAKQMTGDIGAIVQKNLKNILGAQFTQKEGERLMANSYDPTLTEDRNAIRLQRLTNAMEQALKAKADATAYFEKNGTMNGYQGAPIPTDATPFIDAIKAPEQAPQGAPQAAPDQQQPAPPSIDDLLKKYGPQ